MFFSMKAGGEGQALVENSTKRVVFYWTLPLEVDKTKKDQHIEPVGGVGLSFFHFQSGKASKWQKKHMRYEDFLYAQSSMHAFTHCVHMHKWNL